MTASSKSFLFIKGFSGLLANKLKITAALRRSSHFPSPASVLDLTLVGPHLNLAVCGPQFVHAGWRHIGFNMFMQVIFGLPLNMVSAMMPILLSFVSCQRYSSHLRVAQGRGGERKGEHWSL